VNIDERLRTFVAWNGEVPPEASRIDDAEAREHAATWIRRNLGDGVAGAYVIGYRLGERWWTLFFERTSDIYQPYPEGAERWHIEAYDDNGKSWVNNYYYWPAENRWRHVFYRLRGDDFGRYPTETPVTVLTPGAKGGDADAVGVTLGHGGIHHDRKAHH
jgi:hypothetical protein